MYPLNLPPAHILHLSSQLLWSGLFLLLLGLLAAYGMERYLNVPTLVLAHSLTLAGATLGWVHVPQAPVEERLDLRVAAGEGVADDDEVGADVPGERGTGSGTVGARARTTTVSATTCMPSTENGSPWVAVIRAASTPSSTHACSPAVDCVTSSAMLRRSWPSI